MKVLFIEPPRAFWFVMGEYLPPPFGIIQLAAYLEKNKKIKSQNSKKQSSKENKGKNSKNKSKKT